MAERRTPARQSDGTQCSGVLFSFDIAPWRWVGGERGWSSLGARSNTHPLGHRSDCCSASCKRQHVTRDILQVDTTVHVVVRIFAHQTDLERVTLPRGEVHFGLGHLISNCQLCFMKSARATEIKACFCQFGWQSLQSHTLLLDRWCGPLLLMPSCWYAACNKAATATDFSMPPSQMHITRTVAWPHAQS